MQVNMLNRLTRERPVVDTNVPTGGIRLHKRPHLLDTPEEFCRLLGAQFTEMGYMTYRSNEYMPFGHWKPIAQGVYFVAFPYEFSCVPDTQRA